MSIQFWCGFGWGFAISLVTVVTILWFSVRAVCKEEGTC